MINNKVTLLVIYDIVDTKRRNGLIKLLNSYGVRVQKSAFEIVIDNRGLKNLVGEIYKVINLQVDNVRFYELIENKYRIKIGTRADDIFELDEIYIL